MKRVKEEPVKLTKEQKQNATTLIKRYLEDNFDLEEIGNLKAELMLDFITEKLGAYYYDAGITDAMSYISEKAEEMYLLMKTIE